MKLLKWILVICAAVLVVAYAMTRPLQDFVEYWVAAHQLLAGKNPYSFSEALRLERSLGWSRPLLPFIPLNPPWTLPLIVPLGLAKSYAAGWVLWVATLTFIVWWSMKLLLEMYSNGRRLFPLETVAGERILAFTFYPTLICLATAQITPFVLLGLTGFLCFVARKRNAMAGACLTLAAIKPQLVFLVWLALLLWCWRRRTWSALLALAAAIASLLGIALLIRPTLLTEYWQFSQTGYVRIWPSALGAVLRYPFHSARSFPLQFVAPVIGTIWFVFYWRRHAEHWDWKERMPVLITVSVLTAAYGWTLDQVLLLIPIVAIVARYVSALGRIPRQVVWMYTVLNIALILGSIGGPALPYILAPLVAAAILFRGTGSEDATDEATPTSVWVPN